jgi:hypothetical protein
MVLTKAELIASLQNEARILLHLAGKIDRAQLDYRPSPKQRSTIELLRYQSISGPLFVEAAKSGTFDRGGFAAASEAASSRGLDETLAIIRSQPETYASLLADVPDSAFREPVDIFGRQSTRGEFLVNTVLCGCAAYRTQLFLYLKACGRDELTTANLWRGVDPPPQS